MNVCKVKWTRSNNVKKRGVHESFLCYMDMIEQFKKIGIQIYFLAYMDLI